MRLRLRRGAHPGYRFRAAVLAGMVASAGAVMLVGSPVQAAPINTVFAFTGAPQPFVVPAGVCTLNITALGAQGGADPSGLVGGLGGSATATIEVKPGDSLQVNVGGEGGPGATNLPGKGGFPDGAAGGAANAAAGGGGGSSDVRQGGTAVSDRVVVAGGGGGSAFGFTSSKSGGGGGGMVGQPGADANGILLSGGQGGTQMAGGPGGKNNSSTNGIDGGQPNGGVGGNSLLGGAGGGGGFFGGGGGSAAIGATGASGGGGGGGSGFTPNGAGLTQAVQTGNGQVTITDDPASGGCPPVPPSAVVVTPRFTG
jgi:hypothetical protein